MLLHKSKRSEPPLHCFISVGHRRRAIGVYNPTTVLQSGDSRTFPASVMKSFIKSHIDIYIYILIVQLRTRNG